MKTRIAIIGAGPIGLEAALAALRQGYEVTVYEKGTVAASVQRWGHVRMFSPFSMNASTAGVDLLRQAGTALPPDDAYLTGAEFTAAYLEPLARHLPVRPGAEVRAIVRQGAGKRDKIGEPNRSETAFRLLIEQDGVEQHEEADVVLDCSGVFEHPNPLGDGGIPALGERGARSRIRYGLGEAANLGEFANRRVLVVGGGHSAANLIVGLTALKAEAPRTEIHWVVRVSGKTPCVEVEHDPLQERQRICAAANAAVEQGHITLHSSSTVLEVREVGSALRVKLQSATSLDVDLAIAVTGFRPDWSFARELHIQTCWATEGTMPLAASLLGETGGDCLAVAAFGADSLVHPEPGFYALGIKSYGRTPDFLIATGLQQIEALFGRPVLAKN